MKCLTENLMVPFQWKRQQSIFATPEGDLFHKSIPLKYIAQVFAVMEACYWHRFVVLTKRAKRMARILSDPSFAMRVYDAGVELFGDKFMQRGPDWCSNILVGVSVENQEHMHRAYELVKIPSQMVKILFSSPMLAPINVPKEVMAKLSWVVCSGEVGSKWVEGKPRPCKLEWQIQLGQQCKDAGVPFYLLKKKHRKWVGTMNKAGIDFLGQAKLLVE